MGAIGAACRGRPVASQELAKLLAGGIAATVLAPRPLSRLRTLSLPR